MAELGFPDSTSMRAGQVFRGGRDTSPASVVYTVESTFSIFSSSSATVDRRSFASDAHDDSLSSEISQHLAGHGSSKRQSLSGPVVDLPDSNKITSLHSASSFLMKNAEKAKVHNLEGNKLSLHDDEEAPSLDSARNSFSIALKEFQERGSRSEVLAKKLVRRRPASLDLHNSVANVVGSSPRLGVMQKNTACSRLSGNLPSPGTPNYHHGGVGVYKGWSSERVPLQTGATRSQVGAMMLPFSNSRTLPYKWEDAERWIFSPVAGDGVARPSYRQPQTRLKSKSGPLGPAGTSYCSRYSPSVVMYDGSNVNNLVAASPFSVGVLMVDGSSVRAGGNNENFSHRGGPCIARSASVHDCKDLVCQSSETSSRDEKVEDAKDIAATVCSTVSRRDMATQMSPEGSFHSSPKRRSFSPPSPSILPIIEMQSVNSSKPEARDVQVDEQVTAFRWSKKNNSCISGKYSEDVDDWKLQDIQAHSSASDVSERSKSPTESKKEVKIITWRIFQKAKSEAATRKLEMKIEKKRLPYMDKVMNKLRLAQSKAQEMRNSVLANQTNENVETSVKRISFFRTRQMGSLSGCFTCHAI